MVLGPIGREAGMWVNLPEFHNVHSHSELQPSRTREGAASKVGGGGRGGWRNEHLARPWRGKHGTRQRPGKGCEERVIMPKRRALIHRWPRHSRRATEGGRGQKHDPNY